MLGGTVVKAVGGFYYVSSENREKYRCHLRGKIKREIKVIVGDFVQFQVLRNHEAVIEKVLPRKNHLLRPSIANVDLGVVIMSMDRPPFNPNLLNRLLVLIQASDLIPIICFNKADLFTDKEVANRADLYRRVGFSTFITSTKSGLGLDKLEAVLRGKTSVFAGPSGAGKSSILNKLIPGLSLRTGSISKRLGRGRHTTTHVELLPLGEDGWVADTPGFTTLDLVGVPKTDLTYYFPEFIQPASGCYFSPCLHWHEPNCAVKLAVENGRIDRERYQYYLEFLQELED